MSNDGDNGAAGEDDDDDVSSSDRRGGARHLACFPAHLETDEGVQRNALIRDLSVSGALLLTRAKIAVGDPVRLSLYLKEGDEPTVVAAKVVRHERRSTELSHPWTKAVAVHFDTPLNALEAEVIALAEHQAALAAPRSTMGETPKPPARPVSVK